MSILHDSKVENLLRCPERKGMFEKLCDKMTSTISFTAAYSCVASLCAISTIGVLFGAASVGDIFINIHDLAEYDEGALMDLVGTPLAVFYRIFSTFRVPVGWVSALSRYLTEDPERTNVFLCIAFVLGVWAAALCGESSRLPTRPASTLWICLMICLQCGAGGFCGALVFVAVVVAIWKGSRSKRDALILATDIFVVIIAFAAPFLALLDPHSYQVRSVEQ